MNLRDYQQQAMDSARCIVRSGKKRFVVYGPTGSGKTVLAEAFIRGAVEKGKKVAFVANRINLVGQASDHLNKAGIRHGIIQGDNTHSVNASVVVCSIQTVARRGLPMFIDLIVIDEAHGCPGSKAYREMIFAHRNVPVIGLTATPFAKGMAKEHPELHDKALFEELLVSATISDLVEQRHLVDCDIYSPSEPDLAGVASKRNEFGELDYNEKQLGAAVDKPNLIGDIVDNWLEMARHKPTVVFATNIAHSQHICSQFNEQGIPAEHLDCYTEEEDRQAIMARVKTGETRVICNVNILCEGWDFPACEVMVLARPTRSLTRYIQMAGRILRPSPGKTRGLILDHSGSAHRLGYPTDDLPLMLDAGKPTKSGESAKKEKEPLVCGACKFVKPAGVHECPKCGFAPERKSEIVTGEGTLSLVARKKFTMDQKQDSYSQLLAVAAEKKYSSGWVSHKYKSLFGVWPKGMIDTPSEPKPEMRRWLVSEAIRFAKSLEVKRAA